MPLRTWRTRLRDSLAGLLTDRTFRSVAIAALVVAVPVLLMDATPVHAKAAAGAAGGDITRTLLDTIAGVIASILESIINFLVGVVLFMTSALISIAKYNDFINAPPVRIGWVLVRDVVNMFFIVVLLIVSFSTIIGYQPFHYKGVLPKLLLMAVLINFSKTLLGVLIDFSQVVTLTFVNGFQAAAGGNFIAAFQLTKISDFRVSNNTGTEMLQIVIAEILGIQVLVVALTTITIMMIYFLVRVIVIWILLILSPIAFFGTALPDKMQKAISAVTSEWWTRLSAVLTGGPIVAFFLWLSLAVVQSEPDYFGSQMYKPSSAAEVESATPAISKVAEPSMLFTMVVSVALMLTGVSTAVKAAGQLDPNLGKLAGFLKQSGGPVGLAKRYGGRAIRTAGRGAAAGGRIALQSGVGQKAAAKLLQSSAARAGKGGTFNALLGAAGGRLATAGLQQGAIKQAAREKKLSGALSGLTGDQRMQAASIYGAKQKALGIVGDQKLGTMFQGEEHGRKTSVAYRRSEQGKLQKKYEAEGLSPGQARTKAAEEFSKQHGVDLAAARKFYSDNGKQDEVDKIDDVYKKDPSLHQNEDDRNRAIGEILADGEFGIRGIKTEAFANADFAKAFAQQSGLPTNPDGSINWAAAESHEVGKHIKGNRRTNLDRGLAAKESSGSKASGPLTFAQAAGKLSDLEKKGLVDSFARAGVTDEAGLDKISARVGTGLTPNVAEVLAANADHLSGINVDVGAADTLIGAGVDVAAAVGYNSETGAYDSAAFQEAHEGVLRMNLEILQDVAANDRAKADAIRNLVRALPTSALGSGGKMEEVALRAYGGNLEAISSGLAHASPQDRAQFAAFAQKVHSKGRNFSEVARETGSSLGGSDKQYADAYDTVNDPSSKRLTPLRKISYVPETKEQKTESKRAKYESNLEAKAAQQQAKADIKAAQKEVEAEVKAAEREVKNRKKS